MSVKHLISLKEIGAETLSHLVDRSVVFAKKDRLQEHSLAGKVVGIYFRRSSTRTRTSFTVGAIKLGANVVSYGPSDLQLVTGETLEDTGRVLSGYLDGLVIRTNDSEEEMHALAGQDRMAVINAMSAEEHPTQAIADLSTMKEAFGHLEGLHVLYLGEGNNSTSALAFALAQSPDMTLTIVTPAGYGLPDDVIERANQLGAPNGSRIEQHHSMEDLPSAGIDVVYTTRWNTMGVPKKDPDWHSQFMPYSVTAEVMSRVSKPGKAIFMHDLPAVRGDDVTDEVLDGPQSRAWRQANHKMFSAMAVLEWCIA